MNSFKNLFEMDLKPRTLEIAIGTLKFPNRDFNTLRPTSKQATKTTPTTEETTTTMRKLKTSTWRIEFQNL